MSFAGCAARNEDIPSHHLPPRLVVQMQTYYILSRHSEVLRPPAPLKNTKSHSTSSSDLPRPQSALQQYRHQQSRDTTSQLQLPILTRTGSSIKAPKILSSSFPCRQSSFQKLDPRVPTLVGSLFGHQATRSRKLRF